MHSYSISGGYMIGFRIFLFWLVTLTATSAFAVPVEYRFTGELTGEFESFLSRQSFVDTPFTISILADTDNAAYLGKVAGAGSFFTNNSTSATWDVSGLGIATLPDVLIYSLPGLARIGFGWNGQKTFPLDPSNDRLWQLSFSGSAIARDSNYGHLSNVVDPINIWLLTALENPNRIPEYTTTVNFDGQGGAYFKESFKLKLLSSCCS